MLKAEMERAKDNPEYLEQLKKREEGIKNATAAQAMQQFSMQAHARNMQY